MNGRAVSAVRRPGFESDQQGVYADPSAYDILHTPGTAREVDDLERLADRWVVGRRRPRPPPRAAAWWLEPGCGTGRYLRVLASRGRHVVGFDRSPAMVHYAQQRLRVSRLQGRVRLFTCDMQRFADRLVPAAIEFAFNLHNTLRHLPTDEALLVHLEDMARVLQPGGVYAVGISLTQYGRESADEDVWVGRRGRCTVRQVVQYLPPGTAGNRARRFERVVSHLAIERPSGVEHRDATYELRCYSNRQWTRLLERSALQRVATVDWWGRPLRGRPAPYAIDLLSARG